MNRNAEPVVYAEPPPDDAYLGGDQEYYNTKRKAPMSDDENDEDYGGRVPSFALAFLCGRVLLTLGHSDYEEEEDQVNGERDDGILIGTETAGKTASMDLLLWT